MIIFNKTILTYINVLYILNQVKFIQLWFIFYSLKTIFKGTPKGRPNGLGHILQSPVYNGTCRIFGQPGDFLYTTKRYNVRKIIVTALHAVSCQFVCVGPICGLSRSFDTKALKKLHNVQLNGKYLSHISNSLRCPRLRVIRKNTCFGQLHGRHDNNTVI